MSRKEPIIFLLAIFSIMVAVSHIEFVSGSLPPYYNFEQTEATVTSWHALPDAITEPTTIIIVSPEENMTFTTNNLTLVVNIGVQPIYDDGETNTHYIRSVLYNGDWMQSAERIFYHLADGLMAQKITITMNISGISDGSHKLTVYAYDSYDNETTSTVNFFIDPQLQEKSITIIETNSNDYIRFYAFTLFSPLNRTYNSRLLTVKLTFSAGLGIKYTINYNIDEKYEKPIPFEIENPIELHAVYKATGYVALPELSEGSHNLTIYLIGSGHQHRTLSYTETIYFTIDTQTRYNIIPEFQSWIILPIFLTATLVILVTIRNKIRKD